MTTTQAGAQVEARKWLAPVPDDKLFYCVNGEVYRTLQDLHEGLQRMRDDDFVYHSNDVKQDFSNWVWDVIEDARLAEELQTCRTHAEAGEAVRRELDRAHAAEKTPALSHAGRHHH